MHVVWITLALVGAIQSSDPFPRLDTGPEVEVTTAPGVDFAAFHTYAWAASASRAENLAEHIRFTQAIERELARRGLDQDPAGTADVFVRYAVRFDKRLKSRGYTEQSRWDTDTQRTRVDLSRVEEGTLDVDLLDGESRERVWRGRLVYEVERADRVLDQIDASVRSVLSKYPPAARDEP